MAGPAGVALASEGGKIAEEASDSSGFNVLLAVAGVAVLVYVYTVSDVVTDGADAAGGAGRAIGSTVDDVTGAYADVWRGSQDIARGTGDVVEDGIDWGFGGAADVVEDAPDAAEDATEDAADAVDEGVQKTEDLFRGLI